MNKILLDLRDLDEGVSTVELEGDPECLELERDDYTFHPPVRVSLEVDKQEQEVLVAGEVSLPAQVECARCVRLFAEEARARLRTRFIRTRGAPKVDPWAPEDGVREISYDQTVLDLTDDVREAILLALPIRALCRTGCKGLCPVCGANLNEEECSCDRPRGHPAWSALEKLKDGDGEA
jgi:uncharacterized protein